jgi:hypothetical protein
MDGILKELESDDCVKTKAGDEYCEVTLKSS